MEPELPKAYRRATLVDLLDRVLDKGLFLKADLIVCVAGVPLIGVTLSVALAGMETMLKYGMMADWDRATRLMGHGSVRAGGPVLAPLAPLGA